MNSRIEESKLTSEVEPQNVHTECRSANEFEVNGSTYAASAHSPIIRVIRLETHMVLFNLNIAELLGFLGNALVPIWHGDGYT